MRTIYISHPTSVDYEQEIYAPVQQALGDRYHLVFPHIDDQPESFSLYSIQDADVFMAFIDEDSQGRSVEIGWATASSIPTIFITKMEPSTNSLHSFLAAHLDIEWMVYTTTSTLISQLQARFNN